MPRASGTEAKRVTLAIRSVGELTRLTTYEGLDVRRGGEARVLSLLELYKQGALLDSHPGLNVDRFHDSCSRRS